MANDQVAGLAVGASLGGGSRPYAPSSCRPIPSPTSSELRKWMPPQMRTVVIVWRCVPTRIGMLCCWDVRG